jgi:Ni/Co efflux regulator RcnB
MRKLIATLAAAAFVAGGLGAPAAAQRGRNPGQDAQASAREQMQAGREMAPREIERRIIPQMRGSDYLGFEYDDGASAYRLKFLKDGQVTWVDVDARTGRVLRVSR